MEQVPKRHFPNLNIIASYIKDSKIVIDKIQTVDVEMGVLQSSVLGPILWNIPYDGVFDLELSEEAKTFASADDLVVVVGAKNEDALMTRRQMLTGNQ